VEACRTVGGSLVRRSLVRRRNEVYHAEASAEAWSLGCKKVGRQACPVEAESEGGT
jgi:hypothetical protein